MKIIITLIAILYSFESWSIPLAVNWKSDLHFGTVYAGSGSVVVTPGNSESADNASFSISGEASRAFSIILPTNVTLSHNGEGVHNINISNFTSSISDTGVLSETGENDVYVGATIDSIPVNLPAGSYRGNFTIEVIY